MAAQQSWKSGVHFTDYRYLNKLENVISRWLSWSELLQDAQLNFVLFQAVFLVSDSFRQTGLSKMNHWAYFVVCILLGREAQNKSSHFLGLPKAILSQLHPALVNLPAVFVLPLGHSAVSLPYIYHALKYFHPRWKITLPRSSTAYSGCVFLPETINKKGERGEEEEKIE